MKIGVTGDMHGDLNFKKIFMARRRGFTHLIVCGDFGYIWNGSKKENKQLDYLNKIGVTVLFIDGNHENHQLLSKYKTTEMFGGKVHVIRENIIHLIRGEYYTIDNYTCWCMGGANSTDKSYRTPTGKLKHRIEGKDWWREEIPSPEELNHGKDTLKAHNNVVDFIFTHTCYPTALVKVGGEYRIDELSEYFRDIKIAIHNKYKYWFFGHMHKDLDMPNKKTKCIYNDIIDLADIYMPIYYSAEK